MTGDNGPVTDHVVSSGVASPAVGPPLRRRAAAGGSKLKPPPTTRRATTYQILGTELETVNRHNTKVSIFSSAGTFFAGVIVTLAVSYSFSPTPVPIAAEQITIWGIVACSLAVLACYVLAYIEDKSRNSMIQTIKDETIFD
jgi:hypothetical protein